MSIVFWTPMTNTSIYKLSPSLKSQNGKKFSGNPKGATCPIKSKPVRMPRDSRLVMVLSNIAHSAQTTKPSASA